MNKIVIILVFLMLPRAVQSQGKNEYELYVGTFTSEGSEGIYRCSFDDSSGQVTLQKIFKGTDNPSFIRNSSGGRYLYAVTRPPAEVEKSGGYIQAYRIDEKGELHFINKQFTNGTDPCHVDVSPGGGFAAVANYGSGSISLYRLNRDGSLNPAGSTIYNKGSGPNPTRQKSPHAHSVKFSTDGRQLFSADLGTDLLNIYDIKDDSLVSASRSFLKLAPGAGPRHFDFHPEGTAIYVINELNSTVTVFKRAGKKWKEQQVISTVPADFRGTNYCADVHVSADGNYLYGSNRGHNSIAVFKVNKSTKNLNWITSVPTLGDWPRNFVLSPGGRFLLAANQKSGNITVFRINSESGIPEFTGNEIKIPAPVCLVFR